MTAQCNVHAVKRYVVDITNIGKQQEHAANTARHKQKYRQPCLVYLG